MDYLNNLKNNINEICEDCHYKGSDQCNYRKCNIGFAEYVVNNIKNNSTYSITDGEKLIPKADLKYYDGKIIASGIANICKLCKECNEEHSENCVISLIRRAFEYTQLRDRISYPGNVLLYLMNVSKQAPELAELIKQEYMSIS